MNEPFKVGTICIGQNYHRHAEYNGMPCEIIGGLQMRRWYCEDNGHSGEALMYHVRWADGQETGEESFHLRKPPEHPKQSDSQWADEAIRKLKKQSSDHVAGGSKVLIPEEA